MKYPLSQIIRDVRVLLDLDADEPPLIPPVCTGALTIGEKIRAMVEWGARQVIEEAPASQLQEAGPLKGRLAWHDAPGVGMALLLLPDDFLRLVAIRLSDWHRDARIITDTDAEYLWQSSRFPAIRGNPQRPVAVIVGTPMGKAVELYCSYAGSEVVLSKALYQPLPRISHEHILLPSPLYYDIIGRIASLVRQTFTNINPQQP